MSTSFSIDHRASMCTFTFADGRHCRTPRTASHQYLCTYHARKESQVRAAQKLGSDIAYDLSGKTTTANDLTAALCHLFTAVAKGHVKPKTANTLAYLAQTLVQSIQISQREFVDTFGERAWHAEVEGHLYPSPPPKPEPPSAPDPEPDPAILPDSDPDPAPASNSIPDSESAATAEQDQTPELQIPTQPGPDAEPQSNSEANFDSVLANQTG